MNGKRALYIVELEHAVNRLEETLAFYADEGNWKARGHPQIDADNTAINYDGGAKARAVLKELRDA